ncbi:MAG: beta-ACP synthase [Paludibacteraceae bacterium]|nr:beta-ACP synthase [Paludibacteraceae bacterium]
MKRNKVYVSSYGALCGLGANLNACVESIIAEKSAIVPDAEYRLSSGVGMLSSRIKEDWIRPLSSGFSRLERMMITVLEEANVGRVDFSSQDTLFIFSTTKGNISKLGEVVNNDLIYNLACKVVSYYGNPNKPFIISNACISGVMASQHAYLQLSSGKFRNAVVVGGDEFSKFVSSGFDSFHSMSELPCRPYDKNRDGLSLGEAVAVAVYTVDESKSDGSGIMVLGGASSNDANHISGPSRTGDGLAATMIKAMESAGLTAADIPLVLAHGTATMYNDEMECKALALSGLQNAQLVSLKGYFGHTLGASGLLETVLMLDMMKKGFVPRTLGYTENGLSQEMKVTKSAEHKKIDTFLKSASGFGGCNCSVVFGRKLDECVSDQDCTPKVSVRVDIKNNEVSLNGNKVFLSENADEYADFIRAAFKNVSPEPYMKFAKMDDFCKLALTSVEYLGFRGVENTALLLQTNSGCLASDLKHLENISQGAENASPAVFVYTLPNIALGEIAIRHKFKGENLTRIVESYDENALVEDSRTLLNNGADVVIAMYIDYFGPACYSAVSCIVSRE